MTFTRKGKILDADTLRLPWFSKNAMVPVPWRKSDSTIRIFLTLCDERNVGRIGYVDVDASDPGRILDYSKTPLIDVGAPGTYDDNGVVTSSVLEADGRLYQY